ncbi:glycosyltransferase [bacterium]|nr:MAG: glycosyltransferase [bacterium]
MISVIIPARNEALNLPRLLTRLNGMKDVYEIIVADGGSSDATLAVAKQMGAKVVEGARGRGAQQNLAANQAKGDVLWFLHADVLPAHGCGRQIQKALRTGAVGGNFRMRFQSRGLWPRGFEIVARIHRSRDTYYGDSGIWVTREVWDELGGFAQWPLFEDLDFVRRLEKSTLERGAKTVCCPGRLHVSARRFAKAPWRVLWLWITLQMAFDRGVSTDKLAKLYHGASKG